MEHKKDFSKEKSAKGPEQELETTITDDEFYYKLAAEDVNDPANKWEKKMDVAKNNGMSATIYAKSVPGYRVDWIHSDAFYEGITMETFMTLNKDVERMFKGHNQHREMRTLKYDEDGTPCEMYGRNSMGMFMTDRDNLAKRTVKKNPDGSTLIMMRSFTHPDYPEKDDCIRIRFYLNQLAKEVDGGLHIKTHQNIDPRGYIPSSLMNLVLGTTTKEYLTNMNKNMQEFQATGK